MPAYQAAGIIPVRPGGALLLQLRDGRPEIGAPNQWGILGGHVEPGETPEEAAWREIEEECGQRPTAVQYAGYGDGPSLRRPGVTVRTHVFGARVNWTLDDVLVNEGQMLDWFLPEQARALQLTPAIRPAIEVFLDSPVYAALTAGAVPAVPPAPLPLPTALVRVLTLPATGLIAVLGGRASFVRSLWDVRHGCTLTTSPGPNERPDVVLWWPRDDSAASVLDHWRHRLDPGGRLWALSEPESMATVDGTFAEVMAVAHQSGWRTVDWLPPEAGVRGRVFHAVISGWYLLRLPR